MFSKAIYDPAKSCAVEGLLESSIPGRYTPRKMMAPPATLGRSRNSPLACTTAGKWPFSSAAELGTVFRVLPSGLNGQGAALLPRAGASIPGIAPPKQLSTTKSAPVLSQQTPVPDILQLSAAQEPPHGKKGNRGGNSNRSTVNGEPGHTTGLPSVKGLKVSPDAALLGRTYESYHGTGGESRRSRRSSSSCLDHKSSSIYVGSGLCRSLRKTSPESVAVLRTGSFSGSSKVSTPAQRRAADQLALDLATIRSLDT